MDFPLAPPLFEETITSRNDMGEEGRLEGEWVEEGVTIGTLKGVSPTF